MAKTLWKGIETHPGQASTPGRERQLVLPQEQAQDFFMPGSIPAWGVSTVTLFDMNYVNLYNKDWYTETLDGTGVISLSAASAGGHLLTFGDAQNDDAFVTSTRANTVVAGKMHTAIARVAVEDVDQDGFWFGFWTSGDAEIAQAEPADGIYFESGAAVATLIGTVRTATGASADTGTLATLVDATSIELGVQFFCGADAASSWGRWWVNGESTPFTAAQLTALGVAGAAADAVLQAGIGGTPNDTGTDTITVQYAWAGVDR